MSAVRKVKINPSAGRERSTLPSGFLLLRGSRMCPCRRRQGVEPLAVEALGETRIVNCTAVARLNPEGITPAFSE